MFLLFLLVILILVLILFHRSFFGGSSGVKQEIKELVDDLEDKYGKAVLKHFCDHFYEKYTNLRAAVDGIISKYDIDTVEDFIRVSALCQYNLIDPKRAALLLQAPRYMKSDRSIRKKLERMVKCDKSVEFLAAAHRFYKFTDKALVMPIAKLKQMVKKQPESVFEPDELAYKPVVKDYCDLLKKKMKPNDGVDELKKLLVDLYYLDPSLYKYAEISRIFTVHDLANYLRRKLIGYDVEKIELAKEKAEKAKEKAEKEKEKAEKEKERSEKEKIKKDLKETQEILDEVLKKYPKKEVPKKKEEEPELLEEIPEQPLEEIPDQPPEEIPDEPLEEIPDQPVEEVIPEIREEELNQGFDPEEINRAIEESLRDQQEEQQREDIEEINSAFS